MQKQQNNQSDPLQRDLVQKL